jgi:hypothetical protein
MRLPVALLIRDPFQHPAGDAHFLIEVGEGRSGEVHGSVGVES